MNASWGHRFLRLPASQFVLVVPTTAVLVVVVLSAAVGLDHPGVNFGTTFTWVVWWGLLLLSSLVFGRAWCLVCPLSALSEWTKRLSFWWRSSRTAGLDRRWPARLRSLWPATGLFLVVAFLDNGYGLSNRPRMTAGLVVVLALAALWVDLVFERRAFCRYLCPLTAFLGVSALASMFELRCRDAGVCRTRCATKDCFRGNARRWGCPMGEFPGGGMDNNLYCSFCGECVRGCPHDNIALRFRAPGRDLWTMRRARVDGAVAAAVIVGVATIVPLVTVTFLPGLRRLLSALLPTGLPPNDPPRLAGIAAFFVGGAVATVGLVYGFSGLAAWAAGDGGVRPRAVFTRLAYALVPLGLFRLLGDLLDHAVRTWGAVGDVTRALLLDFPLTGRCRVARRSSIWRRRPRCTGRRSRSSSAAWS